MCIIVAKKAGIAMPSTEILSTCFKNNPDGAGFMLSTGKVVKGFKGLMTFEEFQTELETARKRYGDLDKLSVVMHFRITTHGGTSQGNTHPFPIGVGYREMRKTEWSASKGLAHNGVISCLSYDKDIGKFKVSDTMVFVKKIANPILKYAPLNKEILDALYQFAESKLCFLDRLGNISTRGDFIEDSGILYSNSSFNAERKKSYSYDSFHSYSGYSSGSFSNYDSHFYSTYLKPYSSSGWDRSYDREIEHKLTSDEIAHLAECEGLSPLGEAVTICTDDGYSESFDAFEAWTDENFNIYLFDNSFDMFELYIDGESIVDVQLQEVKK